MAYEAPNETTPEVWSPVEQRTSGEPPLELNQMVMKLDISEPPAVDSIKVDLDSSSYPAASSSSSSSSSNLSTFVKTSNGSTPALDPPSLPAPTSTKTPSASKAKSKLKSKSKQTKKPAPTLDRSFGALSPTTLRRTCCPCTTARRQLATASDQLTYLLSRVSKAWSRLTLRPVPLELAQHAELTARVLRDRGWELLHIVVAPIMNDATQRMWSICWLIPDQGELCAHRAVAEIVLAESGVIDVTSSTVGEEKENKGGGEEVHDKEDMKEETTKTLTVPRPKVEMTMCRFEDDWNDWIKINYNRYAVSVEDDYHYEFNYDEKYSANSWQGHAESDDIDSNATNTSSSSASSSTSTTEAHKGISSQSKLGNLLLVRGKRTIIPDGQLITGQMIVGRIYAEVIDIIGNTGLNTRDFILAMGRATRIVNEAVGFARGFDIEKVYRYPPVSGKGGTDENAGVAQICARVAILSSLEPHEIGAVVLVEVWPRGIGQLPGAACEIILDGEWPITHIYRNVLPPPEIDRLEKLLVDEGDVVDRGIEG